MITFKITRKTQKIYKFLKKVNFIKNWYFTKKVTNADSETMTTRINPTIFVLMSSETCIFSLTFRFIVLSEKIHEFSNTRGFSFIVTMIKTGEKSTNFQYFCDFGY